MVVGTLNSGADRRPTSALSGRNPKSRSPLSEANRFRWRIVFASPSERRMLKGLVGTYDPPHARGASELSGVHACTSVGVCAV